MSMIGCLRRLSPKDLERLKADPSLVVSFLGEEDVDGFEPFADLDIDKAWHGIHYLLTGSGWEGAPPLSFLVVGGATVGEDRGYGPARGFSAEEVKPLAEALAPVTEDELRSRYDAKRMQREGRYPG